MSGEVVRWWKFNAVGLAGFLVQMTALAGLHRLLPRNDLWATALALEITLLHNFIGHVKYTWRERPCACRLRQLLRFQLTNGAISMTGNLLGVKLLTHCAHMPLLAAATVAVVCCAVANFLISSRWVFSSSAISEIDEAFMPRRPPAADTRCAIHPDPS